MSIVRPASARLATTIAIALAVLAGSGCGGQPPRFEPVTDPLAFGDVYVNTTATRQAQWRNNGNGNAPVGIVGMRVNPQTAFNGTLPPAGVPNVPANGTSVDIPFTFTPTQAVNYTATVTLRAIDANTMGKPAFPVDPLALSGAGIAQSARGGLSVGGSVVAGQALDFGNVPVGASKALTVDLFNATAAPVTVNGGMFGGPFTVAPAGAVTVPAGGRVTVTITFAPTAVGPSHSALHYIGPPAPPAPGAPAPVPPQAGTAVTGTGVAG